ncbi:asparagine synthase-related protein [Halobacillus campisalis]|uniref:asparagine synthase (glutamine-hydrolyzing) n=1 Tax=Halobacillus campisalis TaxID=435909 RepID=A0ABW2K6Q4_9BACI|nr:asparagine synthase-related protein [Halobacillus campisalis]
MSDFIFSRKTFDRGELTNHIKKIYHEDAPIVEEFHGKWGALAVSHNLYNGFQPYETDEHITLVLGGPVLCYRDNRFLVNEEAVFEGTRSIYERWHSDQMLWNEDLSGPYSVFIVNKHTSEIYCMTDLMSFIPVYSFSNHSNIMLSSHVDILACAADEQGNIDLVSEADFILHGFVTYPFTIYKEIKQIPPASIHTIPGISNTLKSESYWIPREMIKYENITEAASDLRNALQEYVGSITEDMPHIAQFISGGEDSRALSGLLPETSRRDAFVFLEHMNREGKVAKKAANAYGANFTLSTRTQNHYLSILPQTDRLVGSGSQFHHVHTFGFHKHCKLDEYPAVFGGLFADAMLKGSRIKKVRGPRRFPFLPQIKNRKYSNAHSKKNEAFTQDILTEVTKRRRAHLDRVKAFRTHSAQEWFELWPSTMNMNIPNLHGNRRLFRSYEPFMAKDVVKISASVPQSWKLNHRLFRIMAKPLLSKTKWLLHGEGRLPYFPIYVNFFVQLWVWIFREFGKKTNIIKGNQESWTQWDVVMKSDTWKHSYEGYSEGLSVLEPALKDNDLYNLFETDKLNKSQKINLMQVLHSNLRIEEELKQS